MSESGDGGAGRREVAYRLFAAEFDDADFSYSESDEERAPNYVVTPTGARVNRLFVVGVLTEIERVNDEVLRARVVDPTGPFVVYAGQYQPDELAFLESAEPPLFVAVTGKARTFEPDDGDRVFTSIRPESISQVDADTRDRWVVQAAEQTVERIGRMASAKETGLTGDELRTALVERGVDESSAAGITLAVDHYGTTGDYLQALRETSLDAVRVVAGETNEAEPLTTSPGDGTDDPIPVLAAEFDADATTPETGADDGDVPATETADSAESSEESRAADSAGVEESDTVSVADDVGSDDTTGTSESETGVDTSESDVSTAPSAAETEPSPAESAATGAEPTTAADEEAEPTTAADEEAEPTSAVTDSAPATDADAEADGDIGEFEPEFELDDEEREEIEQEYGTDFQSGTEVDEPGAADIQTPDPEEMDVADAAEQGAPAGAADAESAPESAGAPAGSESPDPDADAATGDAVAETPETATGEGADEVAGSGDETTDTAAETASDAETAGENEVPADGDLEDAVMDVMTELDDGSGTDREELLAAVVERYGADPDAVEDAIQDALMGGRCYEPEDGKLTPI